MKMIGLVEIITLCAVVLFWVVCVMKKLRTSKRYISIRTDSENYKKLVVACAGDKERARRLVLYEIKRKPNRPYDEYVIDAFDRLVNDRQRSGS